MISTILVVFDDDTHADLALDAGFALASAHGARLRVLAVTDQLDRWRKSLGDFIDDATIEGYFFEQRRQLVGSRSADHSDIDVEIETRAGVTFVEVIHAAVAANADLIVQAPRPDVGTAAFFTSGDWHLIRKSPIPVMIVKDGWPLLPQRLLAAVDVMDDDGEPFNRRILNMAGSLAGDGHLTVMTAWSVAGESAVRNSPWFKSDAARIDRAVALTQATAEERLAKLQRWFSGAFPKLNTRWVAVKGAAREAIPAAVEDYSAELVVVGTVGRTGVAGLLIGNTAETILCAIRRPIVALKPEGFRSPVLGPS